MNNLIENKVDKTLNSLQNIHRAEPRPFLYTRIMAKISAAKEAKWEKYSSFITQPSIAFSGICLVILMNIIVAYSNLKTTTSNEPSDLTMTEEYTQVATNFYDFENIKP